MQETRKFTKCTGKGRFIVIKQDENEKLLSGKLMVFNKKKIRAVARINANYEVASSNEKPTIFTFHKNGMVKIRTWSRDGIIHRQGLPARIHYDNQGNVTREDWMINDRYNREGAPAEQMFRLEINGIQEVWFSDGEQIKAPADAPFPFSTTPTTRAATYKTCRKPQKTDDDEFTPKAIKQIKKIMAIVTDSDKSLFKF